MSYPYQIKTLEGYEKDYQQSIEQPEEFWANVAETFTWRKKWDKVLNWNFKEPKVTWFEGGKLNITENCLDRHLAKNGNKVNLSAILADLLSFHCCANFASLNLPSLNFCLPQYQIMVNFVECLCKS